MWNATQHNSQCNFLYCGMNVQIQMIQDKSSYWHENNNTSSILTKQSCLLKITWPKKAIPTKSYSLAMLYLHHIKYLNHAQPQFQPRNCFILQYSQTFSTFTQYMSVSHDSTMGGIEYDDGDCVEKTKKEKGPPKKRAMLLSLSTLVLQSSTLFFMQ